MGCRRLAAVSAGIVLFCFGSVSAAQGVRSGPFEVRFGGTRGYAIWLNQVPLTRSSSLQLYAPGWKEGYYSSNGSRTVVRQQGDALVLNHVSTKTDFRATETVRAIDPNHLEITLKGKLSADVDARLEWGLGTINAFALYGGSVSRGGSDMLIAIEPEPAVKRETDSLLGDTDSIRFATRLGRFTVKVEQGPKQLVLLDGRKNPGRGWTSQDEPSMWLGMLAAPVKSGEEFEYRVSIEYQPPATSNPTTHAAEARVDAKPEQTDQAFVPPTRAMQIIPKPKSLKWKDGRLRVGPNTVIVIGTETARPAAELLAREVKQRFDWDWRIRLWKDAPPGCIVIGPPSDKDLRDTKKESYRIDCDGKSATVSSGAAAYRFGVQTLIQLLHATPDGVAIPACEIEDAPSLEFRGVHLFTGRDSVDFYRTLAERVLGRFKFNHVVLECDYTEWDTDKNIWIDSSVPKSQVAEYVKISRENGLEPIPLVQSLGHSEWMFRHKSNLELAEDPQTPYAYAVTNPKTYDFIHKVYDEAIDLFGRPKYFHIGHDEVDMLGRYPQREEAKQLGKTKLFALDVQRHADYFKPKGITPMLWGDMMIARDEVKDGAANAPSAEEAKKRRDAVPKDVVICDWHYQPDDPKDFNSLKVFQDAGFGKVLACTWYNPRNIYDFAAAARLYKSWGLLQTTWAGYHIAADTMEREARQFSAYVLAAEYAWSGDSPPPDQLPWRAEEVLAEAMSPQREATQPLPGQVLAVGGSSLNEFLGCADLSALPKEQRVGGVRFNVTGARVLASPLLARPGDHPLSLVFRAKITAAAEIAFLHATAYPAPQGVDVGEYVITYADGTVERVPLRYGRDIRWWQDLSPAAAAPAGWFGKTANGTPAAARVFRWRNPHPDRPLASITFFTNHPYASPVLFGVTALGSGK